MRILSLTVCMALGAVALYGCSGSSTEAPISNAPVSESPTSESLASVAPPDLVEKPVDLMDTTKVAYWRDQVEKSPDFLMIESSAAAPGTVMYRKKNSVDFWVFSLEGGDNMPHPSGVFRKMAQKNEKLEIEMKIFCEASAEECAVFTSQMNSLNGAVRASFSTNISQAP